MSTGRRYDTKAVKNFLLGAAIAATVLAGYFVGTFSAADAELGAHSLWRASRRASAQLAIAQGATTRIESAAALSPTGIWMQNETTGYVVEYYSNMSTLVFRRFEHDVSSGDTSPGSYFTFKGFNVAHLVGMPLSDERFMLCYGTDSKLVVCSVFSVAAHGANVYLDTETNVSSANTMPLFLGPKFSVSMSPGDANGTVNGIAVSGCVLNGIEFASVCAAQVTYRVGRIQSSEVFVLESSDEYHDPIAQMLTFPTGVLCAHEDVSQRTVCALITVGSSHIILGAQVASKATYGDDRVPIVVSNVQTDGSMAVCYVDDSSNHNCMRLRTLEQSLWIGAEVTVLERNPSNSSVVRLGASGLLTYCTQLASISTVCVVADTVRALVVGPLLTLGAGTYVTMEQTSDMSAVVVLAGQASVWTSLTLPTLDPVEDTSDNMLSLVPTGVTLLGGETGISSNSIWMQDDTTGYLVEVSLSSRALNLRRFWHNVSSGITAPDVDFIVSTGVNIYRTVAIRLSFEQVFLCSSPGIKCYVLNTTASGIVHSAGPTTISSVRSDPLSLGPRWSISMAPREATSPATTGLAVSECLTFGASTNYLCASQVTYTGDETLGAIAFSAVFKLGYESGLNYSPVVQMLSFSAGVMCAYNTASQMVCARINVSAGNITMGDQIVGKSLRGSDRVPIAISSVLPDGIMAVCYVDAVSDHKCLGLNVSDPRLPVAFALTVLGGCPSKSSVVQLGAGGRMTYCAHLLDLSSVCVAANTTGSGTLGTKLQLADSSSGIAMYQTSIRTAVLVQASTATIWTSLGPSTPVSTSATPAAGPSGAGPTNATAAPTIAPTNATAAPTIAPTNATAAPTIAPTNATAAPTFAPTNATAAPTFAPTNATTTPTFAPTNATAAPTFAPTNATTTPTFAPTNATAAPTIAPTNATTTPTFAPTNATSAPAGAAAPIVVTRSTYFVSAPDFPWDTKVRQACKVAAQKQLDSTNVTCQDFAPFTARRAGSGARFVLTYLSSIADRVNASVTSSQGFAGTFQRELLKIGVNITLPTVRSAVPIGEDPTPQVEESGTGTISMTLVIIVIGVILFVGASFGARQWYRQSRPNAQCHGGGSRRPGKVKHPWASGQL